MPTLNAIVLLSPFDHIDGALRKLKKTLEKNGTFLETKKRQYHETRGEKRRRKSKLAQKKQRTARIRAMRDRVYEEDSKPNHYHGDYVPSPNYKGSRAS
jgi:small subunit ribosomal protein S21